MTSSDPVSATDPVSRGQTLAYAGISYEIISLSLKWLILNADKAPRRRALRATNIVIKIN